MTPWRPHPFYPLGRRPDGKPDVRLAIRDHVFTLECHTCGREIMTTVEGRAADRDDLAEFHRRAEQHQCGALV